MNPDTDGKWVSSEAARCHACTAIAAQAQQMATNDHPEALRFSAHLKP